LINYYVPIPEGLTNEIVFTQAQTITLKNNFGKGHIYYTTNGNEPDTTSAIYTKPLSFTENTTIKAKVIVNSRVQSRTATCKLIKQSIMPSVKVNNLQQGLKVTYYIGIIDSFARWSKLQPLRTDTISGIYIPAYAKPDSFALEFNGYIQLPDDDVYTFTIASDDGSQLFINDQMLVVSDGCHGPVNTSKQIALKAGYHKFKLQYFEALYGNALYMYIAGSKIKQQIVPSSMFFNGK
jgi:hexosaminidase